MVCAKTISAFTTVLVVVFMLNSRSFADAKRDPIINDHEGNTIESILEKEERENEALGESCDSVDRRLDAKEYDKAIDEAVLTFRANPNSLSALICLQRCRATVSTNKDLDKSRKHDLIIRCTDAILPSSTSILTVHEKQREIPSWLAQVYTTRAAILASDKYQSPSLKIPDRWNRALLDTEQILKLAKEMRGAETSEMTVFSAQRIRVKCLIFLERLPEAREELERLRTLVPQTHKKRFESMVLETEKLLQSKVE